MVERACVLKLIIEDDEGRKTVVPFVRDEITIGRQEGNTIRLTERNVSRRHARLMRTNGHVVIEDLGSYNGIKINGDRISGQVQIADGDLIQIGDYDLAIQAEEKASAATVPLESASAGAMAPTRKLQESSATMPALPAIDPPQAADEDVREAEDEGEVGKDAPPSIPKHQSTAVIRIDQLEGSKKRSVSEIEVAEAPRLVVLNTDFAGKEFACTRTEMKIGRVEDNDIAIDHRSLSRTHCKVVREESGEWRVIDMQSANGLMVNGESYAQVTLRPGDVIELGHVKLKFVSAGDRVDIPAAAPSRSTSVDASGVNDDTDRAAASKTPLIAMAIAILVVILGGGGYMIWKSGKDVEVKKPIVKVTPPEPVKGTEPTVDPAKEAAALRAAAVGKVAEARAAALELDFAKAEVLAKEAQVDGEVVPEAKALLAELDSEKGNKVALEQADKLLTTGNLEKARTQLDSAAGTKLLKDKYRELDARRQELVKEKVANNTKPPDKTQTPPDKTPDKQPPPTNVDKKNDPKVAEAESLYKEASEEKKAKNFERAAIRAEKCIKLVPSYHPCYRMLGSVYASIATRDQSANDMEKAKKYYERFLEVAPPDDEFVPKVRNILEQAK